MPQGGEKASERERFAGTRIGYVHIDACELRLTQGKLLMFLAVDRVSRSTRVAFHDANTKAKGAAFLREVVAAFPYRLHTVPTDNSLPRTRSGGMALADLPRSRGRRPEVEALFGGRVSDRVCGQHGIEHRLTEPCHPWTSGRAERMNRTVKEATVKAFRYPGLEPLRAHVLALARAYDSARHLKALRWRTPFQAVRDAWEADPSPFKIDPRHLIPGPHTGRVVVAKFWA